MRREMIPEPFFFFLPGSADLGPTSCMVIRSPEMERDKEGWLEEEGSSAEEEEGSRLFCSFCCSRSSTSSWFSCLSSPAAVMERVADEAEACTGEEGSDVECTGTGEAIGEGEAEDDDGDEDDEEGEEAAPAERDKTEAVEADDDNSAREEEDVEDEMVTLLGEILPAMADLVGERFAKWRLEEEGKEKR